MSVTRHPLCSSDTLKHLDNIPLDAVLIQRLEESFRKLRAGSDLAERFYSRLFAAHPELRSMFPADMSEQKAKLLATLSMVIARLVAPGAVVPHLMELGKQHAGFGVQPSHYPLVCDALVAAMSDAADGDPTAWSAELRADWHEAISLVGEVMCAGGRQSLPSAADPAAV